MRFFFFGLLRDPEVLELVTGRRWPVADFPTARLEGARLVRLREENFPILVSAPDAAVPGIVAEGLTESDLDRIRFFESVEYEAATVEVVLRSGARIEVRAFATTTRAAHDEQPWRFEDWVVHDKARALHEAGLWMALHGHLSVEEADRRWDETLAAGRTIEDLVREVCGAPFRVAR
jgi:hypothetical protein